MTLGSYCGVYALYRGLISLDKDVQFSDLVRAEYIGSREGSTADELVAAADAQGVTCRVVTQMSVSALIECPGPTILHVRSELDTDVYKHWILFLGVVNGQARICDGISPAVFITLPELASRWDGVAILLADSGSMLRYIHTGVPLLLGDEKVAGTD